VPHCTAQKLFDAICGKKPDQEYSMKISYKKMAPARKGTLLGLAVVAALYSAPGAAVGIVDVGVGGSVSNIGPANQVTVLAPVVAVAAPVGVLVDAPITIITGDLQVGTATTTVTPVATPGTGGAGLLPYIVDNGDGTSSVFTVTEQNATLTNTTTTSNTGGVLVGADGSITTARGSTTTQVDETTIDFATRVIIDNATGLPIPADARNATGVAGTYNSASSSFAADGGTFVAGTPDTVFAPGGNLNVAGATTLGGAVDMTGNQINNLAAGTLATDAANVGQVTAAVSAEAATRAAADTAEAATRSAADTTLQNNINAEASTRAAAVTAEATTRAAADTTLQTNITNEATARIAGDNALATRLNTTDARVGSLEGRVGVLEKDVKEVRAGVAMAMAIASIPTVDYGKFALGLGVGTFGGETAVAGAVDIKATERSKFRLAVSNAGGQTGGSAGFSVGF
jgi:hypothetical protein